MTTPRKYEAAWRVSVRVDGKWRDEAAPLRYKQARARARELASLGHQVRLVDPTGLISHDVTAPKGHHDDLPLWGRRAM